MDLMWIFQVDSVITRAKVPVIKLMLVSDIPVDITIQTEIITRRLALLNTIHSFKWMLNETKAFEASKHTGNHRKEKRLS